MSLITPLIPATELQDMGVAMVSYPRLLSSAAVSGMKKAVELLFESVKTGEIYDRPDLAVSFEEFTTLMGLVDIHDLEKRFLPEDVLAEKYHAP